MEAELIFVPIPADEFYNAIRKIVHEEVNEIQKKGLAPLSPVPLGLTERPYLSIAEVVNLLGVSRPTLYSYVEEGLLPKYKLRGRVFFLKKDIDALIK